MATKKTPKIKTVSLFDALNLCTTYIDCVEIRDRHSYQDAETGDERLTLSHSWDSEDGIAVADQQISLVNGEATIIDTDGNPHDASFDLLVNDIPLTPELLDKACRASTAPSEAPTKHARRLRPRRS